MGLVADRRPIDLDGVATSRPDRAVVAAMRPWLGARRANPDSLHAPGRAARAAIETARAEVADLVGALPEEIVFTSGATESNNLALKGAARLARREGSPVLAVPAHEHPSILHPARTLARDGAAVLVEIAVLRDGLVAVDAIPCGRAHVVALAHAHAELGSLQAVAQVSARAHDAGARVLVDATLTVGRIPVTLLALGSPDFTSLSFHHLGGPMGVGALVVRGGLPLPPLCEGGVQEGGVRAGTSNVAAIVGAGCASRRALSALRECHERLRHLGGILYQGLRSIPGVLPTGPDVSRRLAGHVSVTVSGVDGEALVVSLDGEGVLAATGSPCADAAGLPSAALLASGYTSEEARGAVLLCVPPTGSPDEEGVRLAVEHFRAHTLRLRSLGGPVVARKS